LCECQCIDIERAPGRAEREICVELRPSRAGRYGGWNPTRERPVTIYRLVNATSIEERVLARHERKQALTEELLRESKDATRLDPTALMALLEG